MEKPTATDWIDRVAIGRWTGLPLFLALFYGMFQLTFTLSAPLIELIDGGSGWLAQRVSGLSPAWLGSLLGDGAIGGVGSVLVFVPPIFIVFLGLAALEDSGYMARAAFVMDRLMHGIGLHGRSFIPYMLGFGCNVPAIVATRGIESPRDRLVTILTVPFMSCEARLPIYVLIVGTFFGAHQGLVIFSLYAVGMTAAIAAAWLLRRTLAQGPNSHFVMELPPYRVPTPAGLLVHTWDRGKMFLRKAGTIIFALAVGAMGAIFAVGEEGLGQAIATQLDWSPLVAYCVLLFTLLYVPCLATLATIRAETQSWRWPIFAAGYTTSLAWTVAALAYQLGSFLTA